MIHAHRRVITDKRGKELQHFTEINYGDMDIKYITFFFR